MAKYNLSPFLRENLACPQCKTSPLEIESASLFCPICRQHFPIKEGICYMLPYYSERGVLLHSEGSEAQRLPQHLDNIARKIKDCDESKGKFYDEKWMIPGSRRESIERKTAFQELCLEGGTSVLDLGAGTLRCGLYALEKGAEIVCGTDLDPGMLKQGKIKAREKGFDNLDIVVADARFIPFRDATFNRVISLELMEHIPIGADKVFFEIFRVLKPRGIAVVNIWKTVGRFSKRREENPGCFRNYNFYKRYSTLEFKSLFAGQQFSKKKLYGHYFAPMYGLLYRLKAPKCLEFGLLVEQVVRRQTPRISIVMGRYLLARLEK